MKLISSTFFIYKDDYFLMRKFFEDIFDELDQKKGERKTQYRQRLRDSFEETFKDVEKKQEEEVLYNLQSTIARIFPIFSIYQEDYYESPFAEGSLKRLELQLYRLNATESSNYYYQNNHLQHAETILMREIIDKFLVHERENKEIVNATQLLSSFRDFWNIKIECSHGIYLEVIEGGENTEGESENTDEETLDENKKNNRELSDEEKFASYFKDKLNALYILGLMYYYGDFIKQDYAKAFTCFEQATEQGNIHAQEYLAWMYFYGEGTEKNYLKSKELCKNLNGLSSSAENLEEAVEKNDTLAQYLLSHYFRKKGRKSDKLKSIEWLKKAAEQGDSSSQYLLGDIYQNGTDVPKDCTIAFDYFHKAFESFMKSAEQGDLGAQINIGDMYRYGYGVNQDYSKAFEWYKKAEQSQQYYDFNNINNSDTKEYYDNSYKWDKGRAQYNIGLLYFNGIGTKQDYSKATEYFEESTKNGYKYDINILQLSKLYSIPVMLAAKKNSVGETRRLISEGIDINTKSEQGKTPLMVAAQFNSIDVAKLLIETGIDFNATDEHGKTALMIAAQYDSKDVAKLLIKNRVDFTVTDKQDKTALMIAAMYNSINVAKLLIEFGAEIDVKPQSENERFAYKYRNIVYKKTPLMLAAINNSIDVAKLLIEKDAEINVKVHCSKRICREVSAFELAVMHDSIDVVKIFIDMDAKAKNSALLYAARYNSINTGKLAIECGARIGESLIEAVREKSIDVVKLLIVSGAYCGRTALKYAISHNLVAISKLLINAGANLDEESDNKQHWKKSDIQFEFHPKDEEVFKRLFILVGQANRYFYLNNKDEPIKNTWTMRSFSMDSNLKACIFSSTCYRENLSKGINKIKLEIPFCEKYENYSLDQVNNEIDDIRQNIFEEKQKRIYQGFNFEIDRITKNNEELTPHSISTSMEKEQQNSTSQTLTIEEEYKIGCEFYKEGLYEKALKHFSNLAEQGYSLAQKSLADMYFKGEGTEKDLAKALEWYEKAAEQGNDNAQFSLGLFFFCGNGVTQDYAEAKNWFEKASAQNNSSASYFLSCMYYNGDGIEKDRQKAQWLFKKARETCNEQEIMELDKLYYKYRCKNATLNIPVEAQNNDLPKKKKVVIIKKKKVL